MHRTSVLSQRLVSADEATCRRDVSQRFVCLGLYGKNDCQSQKRILVKWYHKLMGEFFRLFWRNVNAYRRDRKCFKIIQTNGLSVKKKILMLQNALLRITRSLHSLSTTDNLAFFTLVFMDERFKPCGRLKLPVVIINTATNRNRQIACI